MPIIEALTGGMYEKCVWFRAHHRLSRLRHRH
ncbi:Uncharacterised protein [Vibrio cholerae]|nr:Uncharacterised protein [Vibrio cholerae]CSI67758.1 Uncharacterised protein [Vibrio cholerae]